MSYYGGGGGGTSFITRGRDYLGLNTLGLELKVTSRTEGLGSVPEEKCGLRNMLYASFLRGSYKFCRTAGSRLLAG